MEHTKGHGSGDDLEKCEKKHSNSNHRGIGHRIRESQDFIFQPTLSPNTPKSELENS